MYTFDHDLFLLLNFDGGSTVDWLMTTLSGTAMWIPLYLLIFCLVWRRGGWRGLLVFILLLALAMGLADIIAGIFKHSGLLKDALPALEPRWRPMYTPSLEALDISPDSLRTLRRMSEKALSAAGYSGDWAVHVPYGGGGKFGTVSAHASTMISLATLSALVIRRRWFTVLMTLCTLVICYSRIYLAKHFPMDIFWGALLGVALGYGAWLLYRRFAPAK